MSEVYKQWPDGVRPGGEQHFIIGIVGFIGSGKGTFGDILERGGYVKESFAKPVKDVTASVFGWPRELLEGDTEASRAFRETEDENWTRLLGRPVTPRKILQEIGTDLFRNHFDSEIWVKSFENRILKTQDPTAFVVTDVRFPNEIESIRNLGGVTVRVSRGPDPEWYQEAVNANESLRKEGSCSWGVDSQLTKIHFSEWAWVGHPGISYQIKNDGTIEEFEQSVNHLLDAMYEDIAIERGG